MTDDEKKFFDKVYIALIAAHVTVHEKAFGPFHVIECVKLAKTAVRNRAMAIEEMDAEFAAFHKSAEDKRIAQKEA